MRKNSTWSVTLLAAAAVLLVSCKVVPVGGIEPVSPPVQPSSYLAAKADSLQPTLVWKAPAGTGEVFDVIIFSGVRRDNDVPFYVPRMQLYYREGVSGSSHKVESPLPPETVCLWAVRVRDGQTTGAWSRYSGGFGFVKEEQEHQWWCFKTPKQ